VDDPDPAFPTTAYYLPDLAVDWPATLDLNAQGAIAFSRSVVLGPPPRDDRMVDDARACSDDIPGSYLSLLGMAGGFALFQVALLAGSAMLVSARSDQRSLATVASVGGDSRVLFRSVSLTGAVLGLAGGALGAVL